jgi:hypothetical protein
MSKYSGSPAWKVGGTSLTPLDPFIIRLLFDYYSIIIPLYSGLPSGVASLEGRRNELCAARAFVFDYYSIIIPLHSGLPNYFIIIRLLFHSIPAFQAGSPAWKTGGTNALLLPAQ